MSIESYGKQMEFNQALEVNDVIILCGPKECFSDSIQRTLEAEFPDHSVLFINSYQKLDGHLLSKLEKVSMIIFHESMYQEILQLSSQLEAVIPNQIKVLAYDDCNLTHERWEKCSQFFDCFLPMDVRVDVWLSIVRLILKGGVYVPPCLLNRQPYREKHNNAQVIDSDFELIDSNLKVEDQEAQERKSRSLSSLTRREFEVLELVAKGQQNKNIASKFGLSEHTVKLHVHNIFGKLRVSNRTEAAAIFLNMKPVPQQRMMAAK